MATKQSNAENAAILAYAIKRLKNGTPMLNGWGHYVFLNETETMIDAGRKWPNVKAERIGHQVAKARRILIGELKQKGEL